MADRIILPRATDDNGDIVSGAKATFFVTGTTTPLTVYSDAAGTVPVAVPLEADAEGVFAATFTTAPVKVVVTDTDDVNLPGYPSDPHPISQASGTGASSITFNPITGNPSTDVQAAIAYLTAFWNAVTTFGKSLIAAADKAAARVVLGLGGASPGTGSMLYYNGTDYVNLGVGTTGQALIVNSDGNAPEWGNLFAEIEAQDMNAQTAVDFTNIHTWANRIDIIFNAVSLNGSNDILIQIGPSGGIETTGYDSAGSLINGGSTGTGNSGTGFYIRGQSGSRTMRGTVTLTREPNTDRWTIGGVMSAESGITVQTGGDKTLAGTLTQFRVTRDGANTFDAGSVSARWYV